MIIFFSNFRVLSYTHSPLPNYELSNLLASMFYVLRKNIKRLVLLEINFLFRPYLHLSLNCTM